MNDYNPITNIPISYDYQGRKENEIEKQRIYNEMIKNEAISKMTPNKKQNEPIEYNPYKQPYQQYAGYP